MHLWRQNVVRTTEQQILQVWESRILKTKEMQGEKASGLQKYALSRSLDHSIPLNIYNVI